MKARGKLIFKDPGVDIIALSLEPDNLPESKTERGENMISVTFTSDKIGTILSSVDDYLMNAAIAEKVAKSLKER